jgi:riboflavin kinase/FMN adenylyltransferase
MRLLKHLPSKPSCPQMVLTIGVFDGVHSGHQQIFKKVLARARARNGCAAALTFDRHPLSLVAPDLAPPMLGTPAQKVEWLSATGLDLLYMLPFDRSMAGMDAEQFVESVLVKRLAVKELVVGYDFAFGRRGLGGISLLKQMAQAFGFQLHQMPPKQHLGSPVSSTRIREALHSGDLRLAQALLGRAFSLTGKVVLGDARGRHLGFPTANLQVDQEVLPCDGVWGGEARRLRRLGKPGPWEPFIADLGRRPTFGPGNERRLELHLLDAKGNLYGQRWEARFLRYLRAEKCFDSVQKLVAQIRQDELRYRRWRISRPLSGQGLL